MKLIAWCGNEFRGWGEREFPLDCTEDATVEEVALSLGRLLASTNLPRELHNWGWYIADEKRRRYHLLGVTFLVTGAAALVRVTQDGAPWAFAHVAVFRGERPLVCPEDEALLGPDRDGPWHLDKGDRQMIWARAQIAQPV